MTIERRPLSPEQAGEAIAFALEHPASLHGPERLHWLCTQVTSGPDALFDLWENGQRVAFSMLVDTVENEARAAIFEPLGFRAERVHAEHTHAGHNHAGRIHAGRDAAALFGASLAAAEAQARARGYLRVEVSTVEWSPVPPALLAERGYREAYREYTMRRPASPVPDAPLPEGVSLRVARDEDFFAYRALLTTAFADLPGFSSAPEDIARQRFLQAPIRALLAFYGEVLVGGVGMSPPAPTDDEGEISVIAVDGAWRKRGLGAALLAAGLVRLAEHQAPRASLSVVAQNQRALSLYLRFGFSIASESVVHQLDL
jgi:ribosomal protein S18 acetylase RimI-like enzyme